MIRILVLGGTGWLGAEIVRAALAEGADVTCLARGESGTVPDGARHVRADRRDLSAYDTVLDNWDEVIELASEPELVRPALDALAPLARHWTLVSSVSVYARNDEPGADESAALVSSDDLGEYPAAKVAAEQASGLALSDRLLVVRPGLIVGPGDPTDRFGYWPARFGRSGPVLVPETDGRFVQVIDVSDLASWIATAGAAGTTGFFNAVGEAHPFRDVIDQLTTQTARSLELVAVHDEALRAAGVNYWAGPRSLPLWLPREDTAFARRDGSAFRAAGGTLRPLADTIARVREDEFSRGLFRQRRSGLTPEEEAAVLSAPR